MRACPALPLCRSAQSTQGCLFRCSMSRSSLAAMLWMNRAPRVEAVWSGRRPFTHVSSPRFTPRPVCSTESSADTAVGVGSTEEKPIHADLIVGLRESLSRLLRRNEWLSIADLYSDLPPSARRAHVRPHKALVHVLRRLEGPLDIVVSPSGVYCGRGDGLPADPASPSSGHAARTTVAGSGSGVAGSSHRNVHAVGTASTTAGKHSSHSVPVVSTDSAVPMIPPAVDFFYDVELPLDQVPPAPRDFDVTPSSLMSPCATVDGAVMALSAFVAYIPSFFVPLQEVLAQMPGYSEDHISQYFHLKATEIVAVGGQRFIRLHGGYGRVSLSGNERAETLFARYRPHLAWLPAVEAAFGDAVGEWVPLPVLLSRVPAHVLEQFPWGSHEASPAQRPEAIFFFAQMQHRFAFSFDAEGRGAVLRRPCGYDGLDVATTPTPRAVNAILSLVPAEGVAEVAQVRASLSAAVLAELEAYYGGLDEFFAAHKPVFRSTNHDAAAVVMRTRYHTRMYTASLPLEKQLELALANRQKQKARSLRRQIAFRDNPSHPLHDPDNLAQEVSKYLPRRGFVQLKVFIKSHVPEDLHGFLPRKLHGFFHNHPQYYQLFEYQTAGNWCVSRPGQPRPRGVMRRTFNDDDLLTLCAEYLQQRGRRCVCTTLFLNLPRAAQDMVRKRYGGMFYYLQRHPRHFRLVLDSEGERAASSAIVHLVEVPVTAGALSGATPLRRPPLGSGVDDDEEKPEDDEDSAPVDGRRA